MANQAITADGIDLDDKKASQTPAKVGVDGANSDADEKNARRLPDAQRVTTFLAQPAVQRSIPAIIAIIILMLSLLIYSIFTGSSRRTLYDNLSEEDRSAIYSALDEAGIGAEIHHATGQILVDEEDFYQAKMLLASQGLPTSGSAEGYEMIRGDQSLGTSQFMEQMRYRLAIEEELANSIATIQTIKRARVHLAIPKQSVFIREREKPKASVVVWPNAGRTISDSQVQAIVHMVASSVPFMDADSVSVVDRYGNLLHSSTSSAEVKMSNEKMRYRRNLEEMYRNRIISLLSPFLGRENINVEVNAEVDFTTVESMSELYPGPSAVRSEQLSERRNASQEAIGVPGVLSNEPPAEGQLVEGGGEGGAKRSEANATLNHHSTRNFEVDRTIRHEKNMTGNLSRLTVAMVIDEPPPVDGEPQRAKKSLAEIEELVRGAIGFSDERGDSVVVMSTAFEPIPEGEALPFWKDPQMLAVARQLVIVAAFVLLVLFVFRPLIRNVINPGTTMSGQRVAIGADGVPVALGMDDGDDDHVLREGETLEEMKARLKQKKKSQISAEMLDTANTYDDKVSLVRLIVADDSRRVANVMRGWLKRDIG